MRETYPLWVPIQVRWSDMDAMGHVNNAKYFTYLESARLQFFETVKLWECRADDKHGPALVSATCNFRQQVHFPAELEVGTRVARIGSKSFEFTHAIVYKGTEDVVADGVSIGAWVDYNIGKAIPLPDKLKANLENYVAFIGG
jgi:acyl-CoA thioester hydrolase